MVTLRARAAIAAVLAAATAAAVAGCTSAGGKPRVVALHLVPWDAAVPEALQVHQAAPAPPCRAGQLRAVGAGFSFGPAVVGGTGSVTLRNAGTGACALTGRPQVRAVGAPRAPAQTQLDLPAPAPLFPQLTPPPTALLALPPGASATLTVDWRNWCVPGATGRARLVPPRAIRVTLPGGAGSLDIGYNAVPGCEAPGQPSTLGVRPFQPAVLPASQPWTSAQLQATIRSVSGAARLTGRRGQVVRYAVLLRNVSTAAVEFTRCPLLTEMLVPAGAPEGHTLNCAAAHPIPPGGALGFEMRISIPASAPIGNNGLFWELDPTGAGGPEAVARIVVSR